VRSAKPTALARPVLALALALTVPAISGCSGDEHPEIAGANLYRDYCARCHGATGKGDPRSLALYPNLDLTTSRAVLAGKRGRGLVYQRITNGYGAMPGFGDRLDSQQSEELVDFVLRLPQGTASR
jgi:mono/diheme cytochrome c family protein